MSDSEALVGKLKECVERRDLAGAFALVRENQAELAKKLQAAGIKETLKSAASDRLTVSFVDSAGFGEIPLDKALVALEKLLSFKLGSLVLGKSWGLGTVKKLDYFYKRITVDFKTKRGHQFTYAAAVDMLESPPEGHVLVMREADPAHFEKTLKEKPGEFVKLVLRSYGDMPIVRLEDICAQNGFVKSVNWKKFWESARAELRKDPLVEIPVRRTDPIRLKASAEDYGDGWLTAFSHETDPKLILASVREYVSQGRFKDAGDDVKSKFEERLSFAVTAARKVDDALYARLACEVAGLGFQKPAAREMREYLWERKRFVSAAAQLPSRDIGAFLRFMAVDDESKARLYKALGDFSFAAVTEIADIFGGESACREAFAALMKEPKAPATLVTLLIGKYESFGKWEELPSLITILTHAIALGEGRQNGETLKMQNMVRRLFANTEWLKKIFAWLDENDRALLFERFQASIAWEASTHHATVVRMMKIAPELEARFVKSEKKKEYARITSPRSFAVRKSEYLKLINEDMPANVKRIEFAKSYGDLSENAEYQYAKDEQRALMQKQTLMQADLEAVKPGDFSDAATGEVMPGVTVVVETAEGEKTWTILGEWDNDLDMGIISSKTRVALNLMGKKPGDAFELPGADGSVAFATVKEIRSLSAEIIEWMKVPEGLAI